MTHARSGEPLAGAAAITLLLAPLLFAVEASARVIPSAREDVGGTGVCDP